MARAGDSDLGGAGRMSDVELVERCREGDDEAWHALVDRYSAYVHTIVIRQFRMTPADAEDVFQETFARLYLTLGRLRDATALQAWIGRTARNVALDRIRAAGRTHPVEDIETAAAVEGPDDAFARIDQAMDVRRALDEIGEPCREILHRFFLADESYADISAALAIPTGTVASRISRCLDRLKPLLSSR